MTSHTPSIGSSDACARAGGAALQTLIRWVQVGIRVPGGRRVRLKAKKVGGRWRFDPADLDRFLNEVEAAHAPRDPVLAGATA